MVFGEYISRVSNASRVLCLRGGKCESVLTVVVVAGLFLTQKKYRKM